VHRDMSPPNVLITKHGEVKIVDFGLAKATSQLEKSEPGIIKGKFSYLSPEAATGGEVDHRTDIFAVGIILWELLAGKRLFMGDTDFATVKMVQQAQIPSLRAMRNDVPEDLERIIARSLARDLKLRYSSARDLGRDLTAVLYKNARPVSSFDIAELVRGAMTLRKQKKPDKTSIIANLIDEALLEFTSLPTKDGQMPPPGGHKPEDPLKLGFDNIGSWLEDVSTHSPSQPQSDSQSEIRASIHRATMEIGIGNLAALEDGDGSPPPPVGRASNPGPAAGAPYDPVRDAPGSGRSGPGSVRPILPSSHFSRSAPLSDPTPQKKGVSAIIYVVLALVVGGAVAGAWFLGLIPH